MEEQLLCAVVHEFGPNFAFAADVLAGCSQLQGIFRRASQCKEKFKQLTVGGLLKIKGMFISSDNSANVCCCARLRGSLHSKATWDF